MNLLLRSCILTGKKLFVQETVSFKNLVTHPTYNNNLKKFVPLLQVKHFVTKQDLKTKLPHEDLIYVGPLWSRIRNVKIISITSSALSIAVQPLLFMKAVANDNLLSIGISFAILNLFVIATPLLFYVLTKRYVIEMYYCSKEKHYIAVVAGFFLNRKMITFTLDDIIPPGSRTQSVTTCFVGQYPLFIDEDSFINHKHFNIIMNHNEQSDYELEPLNIPALNDVKATSKYPLLENKRKKEIN